MYVFNERKVFFNESKIFFTNESKVFFLCININKNGGLVVLLMWDYSSVTTKNVTKFHVTNFLSPVSHPTTFPFFISILGTEKFFS